MFVGKINWRTGDLAPSVLKRYMATGPAIRTLPMMPGTLAKLLAECFKRDPAHRPADMKEVLKAMEHIASDATTATD
jgi:hypothetical protein